ncbi:DUF922 domain-containing protein [Vibrio agarivorans]|uniref:DUF922 domain-containing protein n=1 Tax=Vibrio agarivorans TaxID=153622 RepID=A0ABT7XXS1_9VIBR|nr:DUF922 domain-containing protein [Vibrio agarivorans]MDN2480579.1 DUF922 domain-containing protein [Vibrio agarivorans]
MWIWHQMDFPHLNWNKVRYLIRQGASSLSKKDTVTKSVVLVISLLNASHALGIDNLNFPFKKHYEIYTVTGSNADEIEHAFNHDRPDHLKQKGFDGYTAWTYDFHTNDHSCELYEFSLAVTYTLPQIVVSDTSLEAAEEFRAYIEKLYRHEQVHCALTVKSMHDIFTAFTNGRDSNCSKANRRVIALQSELITNNEKFDIYTAHGEIELANSPFGEEGYLKYCDIPFDPIVILK